MVGISGSPDHGRDALTDEISVGKLGKRNDVSKMGRLVEDRNIFVFLGEPTHLKVFFLARVNFRSYSEGGTESLKHVLKTCNMNEATNQFWMNGMDVVLAFGRAHL